MPAEQTTLLFHSATPGLARGPARAFAKRLESEITLGRPFTCLIASDEELRQLNRDFLKNECPTGVLSFPSGKTLGFIGDIAISFQRPKRQAGESGPPVGT